VLHLLAPIRPAQVLQAVVGWVVIDVVDFVLVVPLGEAGGDRHEHVDEVVFAVDLDLNVAAFLGFGGGDHAPGGLESSEGGDLWFGVSFGSFGGFDHFWFVLWLHLLLFKCFKPKNFIFVTSKMEEESIYIVYVLLIYFIVVYVYGVVTYFSYKNTCSNLKNTGHPGQICVSPDSRTARCWNSGSQLSCSHCVFGYKSAETGHVCKSKDDVIEDNTAACKYDGVTVANLQLVAKTPSHSAVTIKYKTSDDYVEPDTDNMQRILTYLQQNCYYDLKIESALDPKVAVKTECENVTTNGDGICRKDYDTHVKQQIVRYRPEGQMLPSLKFTNEVTTTSTTTTPTTSTPPTTSTTPQ